MTKPMRLSSLVLLCLPLLGAWGGGGTAARREASTFILETLQKPEGANYERLGQFLSWDYGFDRSRCLFSVGRSAELGDYFEQRIPLAEAAPVGVQGGELVFACREGVRCIDHVAKSREASDEKRVPRARLLVMDPLSITPLMNAFAELHQLCRDPYAPQRVPSSALPQAERFAPLGSAE